jgi:hypothetical protein
MFGSDVDDGRCLQAHPLGNILQNGAPRPMKVSTIVSPWRYEGTRSSSMH